MNRTTIRKFDLVINKSDVSRLTHVLSFVYSSLKGELLSLVLRLDSLKTSYPFIENRRLVPRILRALNLLCSSMKNFCYSSIISGPLDLSDGNVSEAVEDLHVALDYIRDLVVLLDSEVESSSENSELFILSVQAESCYNLLLDYIWLLHEVGKKETYNVMTSSDGLYQWKHIELVEE